MAIFKRIKNILSADIHDLLDRAEDPSSMLKHYARELEEQMGSVQNALANQLFAERKAASLIAETELVVAKRNRQAELAVERGEENIAELALQERIVQEKKLEAYRNELTTIRSQIATLTDQLRKLKALHDELQFKHLVYVSRTNAAQSIRETNGLLGSFQTDRIMKNCVRLEQRLWRTEAEAEASRKAAEIVAAAAPSQNLEIRDQVQAELQRLKERKAANG